MQVEATMRINSDRGVNFDSVPARMNSFFDLAAILDGLKSLPVGEGLTSLPCVAGHAMLGFMRRAAQLRLFLSITAQILLGFFRIPSPPLV